MIPVTGGTRLFLYRGRADMRRGFDGLSGMVEEHFAESLFSGSLFIFVNRRRDRVKILYWDHGGLRWGYNGWDGESSKIPKAKRETRDWISGKCRWRLVALSLFGRT